jgi:hypothetical protein
MEVVKEFITKLEECLNSIDTFLSKFKSKHEEIAKNLYRCKLNENIPHPPLISPVIEKLIVFQSFIKEQERKVNRGSIANEGDISP